MISPVDEVVSEKEREAIISDIRTALDCMNNLMRSRKARAMLTNGDMDNIWVIRNTLEEMLARHS